MDLLYCEMTQALREDLMKFVDEIHDASDFIHGPRSEIYVEQDKKAEYIATLEKHNVLGCSLSFRTGALTK